MQLTTTSPQDSPEVIREQLRSLYERRSAIDRLIRSLEAYQRTAPPNRLLPRKVGPDRVVMLLDAKCS
jgi:hypothetical protein